MSIEIGQTIGDYEVVSVLGAGGMGRVFKVRNVLSNRFEAMKVLLPAAVGSDAAVERFLREIRVQASLDHPNIAALRTALRIDNQIVMVMELVEGATLQTMLAKGPLSAAGAVGYMKQALLALAYAHDHNVIHRDIKPGNIMLTREGNIKLTDFGIAKMAADRTLTATGTTMGSIYYMSPEQVKGGDTVDARSDLYSLGVTLYEAVSGALPFQGTTDYDVFAAHLNEVPKPPQERNPAVPAELAQVILKAMAKEPANRYQTAVEFREALEKLGPLPTEAPAAKATTASGVVTPAAAATPPSSQAAARTRTGGSSTTASLEMAYVLFMDIVAYSTLPMDLQTARIQELVGIVRNTEEFRIAQQNDQIISLPTGDGMALVFFQNPAAPVQCASEISRELQTHPEIKLRMGVNTGPVYRIPDINTNRNVAGGGINMAQRVMDCGDAGHILVSKVVADTLGQLSDWAGSFHDLGEAEVKHGVKVQIVNYYTSEVGNAELPQKIKKARTAQTSQPAAVAVAAVAASAVPAIPAAPIVIPAPSPSKKGYWIAAGGVAAAILIALGVTQFSHKNESGDGKSQTAPAAVAPAPPSTTVPPPVPPPPAVSSGSVPPAAPPSSTAQPQSTQAPVAKKPQDAPRAPAAQPVATVPQKQPAPQAASEAASAPPAAARSAQPSGPSAEEKALLQEQRERMMLLGGRAAAVAGSVDNLRRQQSASGLGLRPDMAAARASMDYLLGEAKTSLASGDPATTKRSLDMAEQQVEKLEKFLGR